METVARCLGGAVGTGALLTLALPLGERGYLAWIALVPLLAATRGRGFLVGFVTALASVFIAAGVSLSGVVYAIRGEGLDAWVFTGFGLFGFAMALTVALWAEPNAERRPAWWFAAVATLLESVLLVQLPTNLALTQYRTQPVVLLAAFVGIWGVSTLVWWINLAIARMELRPALTKGAIACLVGAALGWYTVNDVASESMRVGIVQTESADEETLTALHLRASKEGAQVVVWPEFSGIAIARPDDSSPLSAIARLPGSAPFVTTFRDDYAPLPHNVAALFSSEGESDRYSKRRLFGAESAMHAPGHRAVAVSQNGRTYGLNICFDSCYPSIVRETASLARLDAILLPTIDPPSRNHFIAAMHAAYSPFRAAETGIAIVRADGYAYSSVVDGYGRIVRTVDPGEEVVVVDLPLHRRRALPGHLGDWWLVACGMAVVGHLAAARVKKRERVSERQEE